MSRGFDAAVMRLWPRSLSGQIALLVAIALFVAQAINFGLLLRERQALRAVQVTIPAVTRLVDAAERLRAGRPVDPRRERLRGDAPERGRGSVRLAAASPVAPGGEPADDVVDAVRRGFADAGIATGRIEGVIRPLSAADPRLERMDRRRADRWRRMGAVMVVTVEMPGRGWLVLDAPWPRAERGLLWQLVAQTLILYGVLLLAVLWIGRRITKPLRRLTLAAQGFTPGAAGAPLAEEGPGDVRALVAAFNGLASRVGAMIDEKDRMLGAIGHDLRTPLSALRVRIESVEDEDDRARMADIIEDMHRTLEDILSLARLGRPGEPATDVDLAALIDAVVEDFRDLGADVVATDAPRTPWRVRPTLMRRAVRNLIENAVKYAGSAEVGMTATGREARITVADRGPGIPPDRLEAVFVPFTRLETSRNRDTGGIGLGLALARAIAREAGGEILLANRDGGGLIATIVLPRG